MPVTLRSMAKAADPRDELVRTNLIKFREDASLSQAQLGDLSGVPVDAIEITIKG